MSDAIWYYVDRAQQRQGPVTADALVAAWHAGDASDQSLVWREGMADWRPLAEHRGELGLGDAAPAYTPPPATPVATPATGTPAGVSAAKPAPAKSNSGCLILGIVAVIGLIAILGIIAAVALPAYHEYVERAKEAAEAMESGETYDGTGDESAGESDVEGYVDLDGEDAGDTPFSAGSAPVSAAIAEGRAHQAQVDDFFANTDRCPRDADELALPAPATPGVRAYVVGVSPTRMCTITIEFGGAEAGLLDGERIVLSRDGGGDWYCTSDMADRSQLPSDCY